MSNVDQALSWREIVDDNEAAIAMSAELSRVEDLCFEFACDGLVYMQYASGRRVPNVYGLTSKQGMSYPAGSFPALTGYDISSDNQIAIGVETLGATIGSARPWCAFTTVDGDFKQRQRAVKKGDYFYGILRDTGFYDELPNLFRDMCAWSYGVGKVVHRPKAKDGFVLAAERCLPSEVLWDKAFSLIPNSSQPIFHQRPVLRRTLKRDFPKFADEIDAAPSAVSGNVPGLAVELPGDFVILKEGWWPDSDETGRHILCVGDVCINPGKTKMPAGDPHPFFFLKGYNVGPGWQYQGPTEQVLADQLRLNKQNAVIWENQHRGAQNRWLVSDTSNVQPAQLINRAAQITTYHGEKKPELVTFQTNPPEMYSDRDATRQRILRRLGVNELAAKGVKPAGLNSGEAIREYGDESSARLTTLARNLEACVVEAVKKLDKLCERVKPVVKAPGRRGIRMLTWDDVSLKKDSYSVELAFPISSLPRTPEGQIDKANELLQMGKIKPEVYARLTLNADVPAEISKLISARDAVESILDDIVGMLADWRDEAKRKLDAETPPPAPMAPAPLIPPGDVIPGPQPSQLTPNIPAA